MLNCVNKDQNKSCTSLMTRIKVGIYFFSRFFKLYRTQKLIINYLNAKALYAFVQLEIPDSIAAQPKSIEDIAEEKKINSTALYNLLQLMVKMKYVKVDEADKYYTLTSLGEYFKSDSPNSMRLTILSMAELIGPAWDALSYSVETSQSGFKKKFGQDFYEYINVNKKAHAYFTGWMAETNKMWILPALDYFDLSMLNTVVDIGGNTGVLMIMLLQKYQNLSGIIFDRSYMNENATSNIKANNLQDRCQFVSGDFFESVPQNADLYTLSRVLDNWDNERSLKILQNCRSAMKSNSKLIIIDSIDNGKKSNQLSLLSRLHVLVMGEGMIRNQQEYAKLLEQAGLQIIRVINFGGPINFIEVGIKKE